MDSKKRYRAEDMLSGQIPKGGEKQVPDNEQELAEEIKAAVRNLRPDKLSPSEADALWGKIESATSTKKIFSIKPYLQAAAAVVALAFGIGLWQYNTHTEAHKLMQFAAKSLSHKSVIQKENTTAQKQANTVAQPSAADELITTDTYNTILVGEGRRSAIHLPDGTQVWLNSGSRLIYPKAFDEKTREVYLEGEGYFDVAHDSAHPFFVRTKRMEIKVLGTEFYLSANQNSAKDYAVLVQGSIAFSSGNWLNRVEKKLKPGEQVSIDAKDNHIQVSQVETTAFQSWKAGYLDIKSERLDEIIASVARYYHVEISTSGIDLSAERFSGRLDLQRSVGDVVDILCMGTPYQYNATERRLELRKH